MSEKLRQHRAFLNLLATASVKQRRVLMKTLSIKQLKTLLEVFYNVIHNRGILPSDSFIKNLYNYWHLLHRLAKKKGKDKKKKTPLPQHHGFLPVLLKPLLPELVKYVNWICGNT